MERKLDLIIKWCVTIFWTVVSLVCILMLFVTYVTYQASLEIRKEIVGIEKNIDQIPNDCSGSLWEEEKNE